MTYPVRKLVLAGLFLALCMVLPFLTAQNQQLGNMLCLMHIPVLLCGFACGGVYGLLVGAAAPLLRYLLLGMPPIQIGLPMAFELGVYGLVTGLIAARRPKTTANTYLALIAAMILGRVVWGVAKFVVMKLAGDVFTMGAYLSGAFVIALPGIAIQLVLIPILVTTLRKAKIIE